VNPPAEWRQIRGYSQVSRNRVRESGLDEGRLSEVWRVGPGRLHAILPWGGQYPCARTSLCNADMPRNRMAW
jgi:hypothetical protein